MNNKTWCKIRHWKKKYNATPNGWAVALLIGEEYKNEDSKLSVQARKKKRRASCL